MRLVLNVGPEFLACTPVDGLWGPPRMYAHLDSIKKQMKNLGAPEFGKFHSDIYAQDGRATMMREGRAIGRAEFRYVTGGALVTSIALYGSGDKPEGDLR
jgi:hypothetical protein